MIKSKKGDAGQIFLYITAILIVGLMFYFGFKWIADLVGSSEKIDIQKLQTDLGAAIDSVASDYGSIKRYDIIHLPSGTAKVCFIDLSDTDYCCDSAPNCYASMLDSWQSGAKANVFIYNSKGELNADPLYFEKMKPGNCTKSNGDPVHCTESDAEKYFCTTPKDGIVSLRLEGAGAYTSVKEWS